MAKTDDRKNRILLSKSPYAIQQINDCGTWANSDSKKEKIFKSQCSYAIQQIDDKSWATFLKNNGLDISVFRKRLLVGRIRAIEEALTIMQFQ